jgi:hypothetical protein
VDESATGSAKLWSDTEGVCPRSGPVEGVWGNREVSPARSRNLATQEHALGRGCVSPADPNLT